MATSNSNVVVIDVKKWCRGAEHNEKTGKFCAVGFVAEQGKYLPTTKITLPTDIHEEIAKYADYSYYGTTTLEDAIVRVNDEVKNRAKRREMLKQLFKLGGLKLKFKNL